MKRIVQHNGLIFFEPCNIYESVEWGDNCQVGMFSEIGNNVKVGHRVRIGAMCFIPEGVTIEDDAWIGPHTVMTNDRFPPSPKKDWERTIIRKGARIGAGVTIVCGVEIGEGALIGAGSTVTKDIPPGETWAGNPAQKLNKASLLSLKLLKESKVA